MKEMPLIKSEIRKSKDGKWMLHVTKITHIKPVAYYEAILANDGLPEYNLSADELARLEAEV